MQDKVRNPSDRVHLEDIMSKTGLRPPSEVGDGRPGKPGRPFYLNTTVRLPLSSTRSSTWYLRPRASTAFSMSLP